MIGVSASSFKTLLTLTAFVRLGFRSTELSPLPFNFSAVSLSETDAAGMFCRVANGPVSLCHGGFSSGSRFS